MIPPRFATSTGKGCIVEATDGERVQPVCVCYGSEEPNGDAATARRIAALLNFAEGVPTEELCGSLLTLAAATTLAAEELRIARAATARRIAALLNFAEGVPTEELCGSLLTLAAATTLAAEELRIARAAVRLHRVPVSLAGVS